MSDTVPMQYQQAHYSKPITPLGDDSVNNTMIQMKLNDEDKAFMNRVRNQGNYFYMFICMSFYTINPTYY